MSAKVIELYNIVKTNSQYPFTCTVIAPDGSMLSGFLTDNISFSNSNEFSNSLGSIGGSDSFLSKAKQSIETVANIGSEIINHYDGSGKPINPLNTRQLWQSFTSPTFTVDIHLFTLSYNDNIIEKAKKMIKITTPTYSGGMITAPGGYKFNASDALTGHAINTWSIRLGQHFSAMNLICNSLDVTISKEHVRLNDPKNYNALTNNTQPLYITLKFEFMFDRMVFSDEVDAWLSGSMGVTTIGAVNGLASSLTSTIANGVQGLSKAVSSGYEWAGNLFNGNSDKDLNKPIDEAMANNKPQQTNGKVKADPIALATNNVWNRGIG